MGPSDKDTLEQEIEKHYGWYNHGTLAWSTAHHVTLFVVPVLTAAATVLLKTDWAPEVQIILTTAATVLASIAASQGFAKKWQANRLSRSRLDQLRVEMTNPHFDRDAVREKLVEIIRQHDEGVLAAENAPVALPAPKHKKP
jgi:hypothetical protein